VAVDEAWDEISACDVDNLGFAVAGDVGGFTDVGDEAVLDSDVDVLLDVSDIDIYEIAVEEEEVGGFLAHCDGCQVFGDCGKGLALVNVAFCHQNRMMGLLSVARGPVKKWVTGRLEMVKKWVTGRLGMVVGKAGVGKN
jgi:hypothetical protein